MHCQVTVLVRHALVLSKQVTVAVVIRQSGARACQKPEVPEFTGHHYKYHRIVQCTQDNLVFSFWH
jgi:hypothetical protein